MPYRPAKPKPVGRRRRPLDGIKPAVKRAAPPGQYRRTALRNASPYTMPPE